MTPELSQLVAAADAAKQAIAIRATVVTSSQLRLEQAQKEHDEAVSFLNEANRQLADARAAIDAALDADYGYATPVLCRCCEPPEPGNGTADAPQQPVVLTATPEPVAPPQAVEVGNVQIAVSGQ